MFFAVCGQINGLLQFKVDSICFPMFPHCGSSIVRPSRPLPYAKLSGTNPEIGTCRGNFSINRLLEAPLIARPLTVACSILSRIQQAISFLSVALNPRRGSISAIRLLDWNYTRQVPIVRLVPLSLARGSGLLGPIMKEPQCGNIGKQIDWIYFEVEL